MDECGVCSWARSCDGTFDLMYCTPKDIFRIFDEKACSIFLDEEEGLIDDIEFSL